MAVGHKGACLVGAIHGRGGISGKGVCVTGGIA